MNNIYFYVVISCLSLTGLGELKAQKAEEIIGAFEFAGDIYVSFKSNSANRFLSKKVEGYLSTDVLASTLQIAVDVVYSTKYSRIYAIYKTNSEKFIAHAIHQVNENPTPNLKAAFGIISDPDTKKTMAVYLNTNNQIISFPLD
ncbi:MAG: hypothetical protein RIA69_14790 [Cyclobacteriaceae bacterium]